MASTSKDNSRKLGSISGTVGEAKETTILSRSGSFKNLNRMGSFERVDLQFSSSHDNFPGINQTDSKDSVCSSGSPASDSKQQKRFLRPSVKEGIKHLQNNIKQKRDKARVTFGRAASFKQQDCDSIFRSTSPPLPEINQNLTSSQNNSNSNSKLPSVRLTSVVWKRRSGLGKLSTTKAWERRRICLKGTRVEYYATAADKIEHNNEDMQTTPQTKMPNWMEQATQNAKATLRMSNDDAPNAPRGSLDLIKEEATVTASSRNNSSPTPFSLSIKVKGIETGWKLCFDSHTLQMEWLAALTDVIVSQSVTSFNRHQLLEPEIRASMIDEEPDILPTATPVQTPKWLMEEPSTTPPPTQEQEYQQQQKQYQQHIQTKIWGMEKYCIGAPHPLEDTSDNETQEDDDTFQDEEQTSQTDADEFNILEKGSIAIPHSTKNIPSESQSWLFTSRDLHRTILLLNLSLVIGHATSHAPYNFWYLFTFTNMAMMSLISRQKMFEPKSELHPLPNSERRVQTVRISNITKKIRNGKKREGTKLLESASRSIKSDVKPQAGSTSLQIENTTDLPMFNDHIFAAWRAPEPENLLIRSHGYLTSKKKVSSPGSLYDIAKCDIFESPHRYPDMASRVVLPTVSFAGDDGLKTWKAPDIFVVSISLPTDQPKLTGTTSYDGGGYTVCLYLTMKQDTRDILRRITAEDYDPMTERTPGDPQKSKVNAVKLFEQWCRRAPNDGKFQSRFKVVPNAQNLKDIGMPSWISRYNGKPFLIKRPGETGFLYDHPEKSCMEFDISLHPFPYLAKHAICFMKDVFFKKVLITFGFVIEGRADDELPECLIGLMQLCYPDPIHAIQAEDLFSGVSAKSHEID